MRQWLSLSVRAAVIALVCVFVFVPRTFAAEDVGNSTDREAALAALSAAATALAATAPEDHRLIVRARLAGLVHRAGDKQAARALLVHAGDELPDDYLRSAESMSFQVAAALATGLLDCSFHINGQRALATALEQLVSSKRERVLAALSAVPVSAARTGRFVSLARVTRRHGDTVAAAIVRHLVAAGRGEDGARFLSLFRGTAQTAFAELAPYLVATGRHQHLLTLATAMPAAAQAKTRAAVIAALVARSLGSTSTSGGDEKRGVLSALTEARALARSIGAAHNMATLRSRIWLSVATARSAATAGRRAAVPPAATRPPARNNLLTARELATYLREARALADRSDRYQLLHEIGTVAWRRLTTATATRIPTMALQATRTTAPSSDSSGGGDQSADQPTGSAAQADQPTDNAALADQPTGSAAQADQPTDNAALAEGVISACCAHGEPRRAIPWLAKIADSHRHFLATLKVVGAYELTAERLIDWLVRRGFLERPAEGAPWRQSPLPYAKELAEVEAGLSPIKHLFRAVRRGDDGTVSKLLNDGVPPRALDQYGVSALHLAADKGHLEVLRLLVDGGADIDGRLPAPSGQTALHRAVVKGHWRCVAALVKAGASLDLLDGSGNTALALTVAAGAERAAMFLLNRGASPTKAGPGGTSALARARKKGCSKKLLRALEGKGR